MAASWEGACAPQALPRCTFVAPAQGKGDDGHEDTALLSGRRRSTTRVDAQPIAIAHRLAVRPLTGPCCLRCLIAAAGPCALSYMLQTDRISS